MRHKYFILKLQDWTIIAIGQRKTQGNSSLAWIPRHSMPFFGWEEAGRKKVLHYEETYTKKCGSRYSYPCILWERPTDRPATTREREGWWLRKEWQRVNDKRERKGPHLAFERGQGKDNLSVKLGAFDGFLFNLNNVKSLIDKKI